MITCLYLLLPGFFMPLPEMGVGEKVLPMENLTPAQDFTYLQLLFYLFCFVVVLFLAFRVSRWLGGKVGGRSGHHLRLVETLYLGPNRSLHLILVGQQLFLVASAERSITLLEEIKDVDLIMKLQEQFALPPTGPGSTGAKNFAEHLKRLLEGGATQKEATASPEKLNSAQRIEERLMKFRTHRGQKTDE